MADYLDRENEAEMRDLVGRCEFGVGVGVVMTEDGRVLVGLKQNPIDPESDDEETRAFLTEIALGWLDKIESLPPVESAQEEPLTFIIV